MLLAGAVIWLLYFVVTLFGSLCPHWLTDTSLSWAACSSRLSVCEANFECFWGKLPLLFITAGSLVLGGAVLFVCWLNVQPKGR